MTRVPTVSVIVCFLDERRFLREAVDSVRAQTFDDWELLLVDDGSSDGSSDIARGLAASQPDRIRYLEHEGHRNLGLSASRNAGIAQARGRCIALLDADDVWLPDKLERQLDLLEHHPDAAMVIGASEYWHSWDAGAVKRDETVPIGAPQDGLVAAPKLMTLLYPLGPGAAPPPSTLLLRSDCVRSVGGFEASFRGPLMLYEDQAFLSKIYRRYPVYVASACWTRYRQRRGSIVQAGLAAGRYWQVRLHFLRWLAQDLARSGGAPDGVWPALREAMRAARRHVLRARVSRGLHVLRLHGAYRRLRSMLA